MRDETYYTVSEQPFFLGTVMLLNSLRLTGNAGRLVVLDAGLSTEQRALLAPHAEIVSPPRKIEGNPCLMKPYPHLFDASGTVVVIDSDIVVTAPLADVLELADQGKIVACPAWADGARTRWFAEWEQVLKLRAPLRREDWFHNGFVVFSMDSWPQLLERWWELCELVPPEQAFVDETPFNAPDADALNALLMSEISRDALALLPPGDEAFGGDIAIEDVATLSCTLRGRPTRLLHYPDSPKPWQPRGWIRAGAPAYTRLMRRLLFAPDVPLRVEPDQVPVWLRPTLRGRIELRGLEVIIGTGRWTSRRLPEDARNRLREVRRALFGRRRADEAQRSTA